jgi:hypothetical protein
MYLNEPSALLAIAVLLPGKSPSLHRIWTNGVSPVPEIQKPRTPYGGVYAEVEAKAARTW